MGVELRMGLRATNVDFDGIDVKTPDGTERIHAHTVIWAAGVAASPLAKMLGDASGADVDRAGRVSVLPDCTLPGHPEVFAIGDMMSLDHLPGVAEVAMQQGLFAGRTIRRRLQGDDQTVRSSTSTSAAWPRSDGSAPLSSSRASASAASPVG